jgi:hypothetical protein
MFIEIENETFSWSQNLSNSTLMKASFFDKRALLKIRKKSEQIMNKSTTNINDN